LIAGLCTLPSAAQNTAAQASHHALDMTVVKPETVGFSSERLERLHTAAGRPGQGLPDHVAASAVAIQAALANDLDVPAALDIAEEEGGPAARSLSSLLGLW